MPDFGPPSSFAVPRFLDEATTATGLGDFGGDEFLDGLEVFCRGARQDRVTAGGRRMLGGLVVDYLANRLRVVEHHRTHPALATAPVDAPIVILGLPRTGTTVLSYLLDQDPRWRSLLNWEAVDSVPPATSATLRTDPRCTALLEFQQGVLPVIDPPPPHWEWADGPTECTFLLAQDFKAAMWESRVPSEDYRDFISSCDMASAYRYHRRSLQVLQSEAPGRWVLKMPAHAYFVDALLAEYPDARIIWTHRDPAKAAASFMNLNAFAHRLSMGEVDREWIARHVPARLVAQVERPMRALAGHDVHHVHYHDTIADPLGVVAGIYDWLGEPLTDEIRAAMQSWLTADPLEASRRSQYALADFGVDRGELLRSFRDYIDAFGVQVEGGADT